MAVSDYLTQQQVEEMMNQRFGVPEGTPRSSPLDFQYQEEEYPDSISRSRLYNQREGMYSPKMQTQDPDAYYKNVQALQDDSRPRMGILDYKGPFSKPEDREWPYVEYEETADKPGGHSWQHNYVYDQDNPTLDYETDPMLMEALIRQKQNNLHGVPQNLGFKEESETISTPLDMERFAGVSELGRNDADVEQVDYLGNPTKFQNFKSKMGDTWSGIKDKFSNFKMPPLGIMGLINAIGNQFEDRQLTGDVMDEYGQMYSAEELNKMNAKGGYYTDPARSARRRTSRIAKMRERLAKDKKISDKNLRDLVRQEKAQQLRDAQDAADRANIQNIQNYTGQELSGYRMSRPASERQFTGGAPKGTTTFDTKSGMGRRGYANGGLASLFTRRG